MSKDLELKGRSTITVIKTQEHKETPKSTRFINTHDQNTTGNATDPEEYTSPPPILLEDEGVKIQRQRRLRTYSYTEKQTKIKHSTAVRKDILNAKRKLESPEEREENKNRKKAGEETERRKAEEEFLREFKSNRRLTRSPQKVTEKVKEEEKVENKEESLEKTTQGEDLNKGEKMEVDRDEWNSVKTMIQAIAESMKGLKVIEEDVKEVKRIAEENRDRCKEMEKRYERLEARTTRIEQEVERKVDEEKMVDLKEEITTEKEKREANVKELKEEIKEIRKDQDRMKERTERERRRNNILITGLNGGEIKEKTDLEQWIKNKMGVAVNLKRVWKAKKGEMIGAECKERSEKEEIMKVKKEKLEGEEIFISHDKTWTERENERKMRNWLKSRTQEDRNIAKVRHNRVIIGETEWHLEEEEGKMKVFIPRKGREEGGTGEDATKKKQQT